MNSSNERWLFSAELSDCPGESESSGIPSTSERGVCRRSSSWVYNSLTLTPLWLKKSVENPKADVAFFLHILLYSFFYYYLFNLKFSLKCKGFLPLWLTLLQRAPNPPHCIWELFWALSFAFSHHSSLSFRASDLQLFNNCTVRVIYSPWLFL